MMNKIHEDGHALRKLMRHTEREANKPAMGKETDIRHRLRGIDNEYEPDSVMVPRTRARSWKNDHLR